jgi:hypothetical protein
MPPYQNDDSPGQHDALFQVHDQQPDAPFQVSDQQLDAPYILDQHNVTLRNLRPEEIHELDKVMISADNPTLYMFREWSAMLVALDNRFFDEDKGITISTIADMCGLTSRAIGIIFRMCGDMDINTLIQFIHLKDVILNDPRLANDFDQFTLNHFFTDMSQAMETH